LNFAHGACTEIGAMYHMAIELHLCLWALQFGADDRMTLQNKINADSEEVASGCFHIIMHSSDISAKLATPAASSLVMKYFPERTILKQRRFRRFLHSTQETPFQCGDGVDPAPPPGPQQ